MGHKRNIGIAKKLNLLNEFIHAINKCETKQEVYDYLASLSDVSAYGTDLGLC